MHHGTKSSLTKILIAGVVGAGAFFLAGYSSQRVTTLQKYPWIGPVILIGIGLLLARRGRFASGLGLAGAGGALALMQAQQKGYLTMGQGAPVAQAQPQPQPKPAAVNVAQQTPQALGYPDAGRALPANNGWNERPASAGMVRGAAARALLQQQNTMGTPGDAGAMLGRASQKIRDAMGLAA